MEDNNTRALQRPRRLVSKSQIEGADQQWYKNYLNYLIDHADLDNTLTSEMDTLARAREGKLNIQDYSHILNPFKFNEQQQATYKSPGKLRNYPLIGPVCDLYMAEYRKRPKVARVISLDEETETKYMEGVKAIVNKALQQEFINELNAQGYPTDIESMPPEKIKEMQEREIETLSEELTQQGQDAIDFLKYDLKLTEKMQAGFNDWLTFGRVISYKNVTEYGIEYEIVSPRSLRFTTRDNIEYIEDLSEVLRVEIYSFNEIVDRYDLNDEEIDKLEAHYGAQVSFDGSINAGSGLDDGWTESDYSHSRTLGIEVYHGVWSAGRKVGILTYMTPIGEIEEREVDETYKLQPDLGDIDIKWTYVNYIFEGTRIGENIYKNLRTVLVQRQEVNAYTHSKLPYNGKWVRTRTGGINSIVKTGLPFQYMYNFINFSFEKIMAKNKDKILLFPIGLIPKKHGWDEDKFMYSATNLSFAFYDESHPKAAAQLQGIKVLDLNLSDYAAKTYEILQAIKQEYWDAIGMNRQRFGDSYASDGKAVTEQAIFRSSMITEEYYSQFDDFYESELNGLLDYSKVAWIKGKQAKFRNTSKRLVTLNILGPDWLHRDWKVFIGDSLEESNNLQSLKQVAMSFIQNSPEKSVVADVIDADNMTDLKRLLKQYDRVQADFMAKQNENEQAAAEMEAEKAAREDETKRFVAETSAKAQVDVALINNSGTVDREKLELEREKLEHTKDKDTKTLEQDKKEHNDKMALDRKKLNKSV
jgi:hypothetical protein